MLSLFNSISLGVPDTDHSKSKQWKREGYSVFKGFPGCSVVKNPPAMQEVWVQSLCWEDPLEKERLPTLLSLPGKSWWATIQGVTKASNMTQQLNNNVFKRRPDRMDRVSCGVLSVSVFDNLKLGILTLRGSGKQRSDMSPGQPCLLSRRFNPWEEEHDTQRGTEPHSRPTKRLLSVKMYVRKSKEWNPGMSKWHLETQERDKNSH